MAQTETKSIKKDSTLPMEQRYPRNISIKMFDSFQLLKRKGDAKKLMKITKLSRPVVDRALKYGHVTNKSLALQIAKFLNDRLEVEKDKGIKLIAKGINK